METIVTKPRIEFESTSDYKLYLETLLSNIEYNVILTLEPGDCTRYEFLIIQESERWIVGSVPSKWICAINVDWQVHPSYVQEKVKGNMTTVNLLCDLVNLIRGIDWQFYVWRD